MKIRGAMRPGRVLDDTPARRGSFIFPEAALSAASKWPSALTRRTQLLLNAQAIPSAYCCTAPVPSTVVTRKRHVVKQAIVDAFHSSEVRAAMAALNSQTNWVSEQ